jgi:hypothetical protein
MEITAIHHGLPMYPADGSLRGFARATWRGTTNVVDGSMGLSFNVAERDEPVRLLLTAEHAVLLADVIAGYVGASTKSHSERSSGRASSAGLPIEGQAPLPLTRSPSA